MSAAERSEWEYAGHQSCRAEIERLRAQLDLAIQTMNEQTTASYSVLEENDRLLAEMAKRQHSRKSP